MYKAPKAVAAAEQEIKFISLPGYHQLEAAIERPVEPRHMQKLQSYSGALHRIKEAQRQAAVIAAELLRPQDLYEAKAERRRAVEEARKKYQDAAVAVFSETCTKGL